MGMELAGKTVQLVAEVVAMAAVAEAAEIMKIAEEEVVVVSVRPAQLSLYPVMVVLSILPAEMARLF